MSREFFSKLPRKAKFAETKLRANSTNGAPMKVMGTSEVGVANGKHQATEKCVIVDELNMTFIFGLTSWRTARRGKSTLCCCGKCSGA